MPLSGAYFTDRSQEIGMAEVIVPPTSELVGKTVVEARFRSTFRFDAWSACGTARRRKTAA